MNEWINQRMKEWMNEWMNEWINEWINEMLIDRFSKDLKEMWFFVVKKGFEHMV